jgi:hypothetical protein
MNVVASSLTNEGITMGSLDILNPFGFRAVHRDETTLVVNGGDHHRVRAFAAGFAPLDLESGWNLGGSPSPDHQFQKLSIHRPRHVGRQLR